MPAASTPIEPPGRGLLDGKRVVIDYCHNVAGLEAMADFVRRMDADRRVGLIAMPGDRLDDDIRAFGTLAGKTFDELVIREDVNRRGRAEGEVAGMLAAAARAAGLPEERVTIVLEELEAAREAVGRSGRNDLTVLFVDKPAQVYQTLVGRA